MPEVPLRPVHICLYATIPERVERRRHVWPPAARAKGVVKHGLNRLLTRLTGRLFLEPHHYMAMAGLDDNSNRGDIAIRIAVREQLAAAFAPRQVVFLEVAWGALNDDVVAQINRSCDLFVIGGGGYMFVNADGSLGERFGDLRFFAGIKIPVHAYGIGLNRLMHEKVRDVRDLPVESQDKIARLGAICRHISVRDPDARLLFELYSGRTPALIGDPVLFLEAGKAARPPSRACPVIGINLAAHSWRAIAVLKPLLPALVALLKDVQQKADLVYLLHHDMERPLLEHLRWQGLRFVVADGDTPGLLARYAGADFVICQMLHSCIFAANAGTPFLNIAYDQKSLAFCSLMGVPECGIAHDGADAATLAAMFETLFNRRAELAATLDRHKQELHRAQQLFAGRLAEHEAQRPVPQDPASGLFFNPLRAN